MVRATIAMLCLSISIIASESTDCDVLVLGAGLSGTSAAWRLVGEQPGLSPRVCLIEASDRVGGRTKDHHVEGCSRDHVVELGAQWIAQQEIDSDVWDLALNVLNLGIFNGWPWALYGFPYGPAQIDPAVKARLDRVPAASSPGFSQAETFFGPKVSMDDPQAPLGCQERVARVYESIEMAEVWRTKDARVLDGYTPLEFLDAMGCNITRADLIAQGLNQVNITHPDKLPPAFYVSITSASSSGQEIFWLSSALWWLHAVKSNSGTISMAVDVQRYRIAGGPQQMSQLLVEKLKQAGATVVLSSPVSTIRYDDQGVEFVTRGNHTYRGRYAIITGTPVALSTHLHWEPTLPSGTARMLSSARIGNYNKHYAFFNQGPTWRQQPAQWANISQRSVQWPMVYTALPPLPADSQQMPNGSSFFPSAIIDNSPVSTRDNDHACPNGVGALFSFGWPQNGSTAKERAQGWYDVLKDVGLPAPSSVVGQAWAEEEFIMGAYGAWWPPMVLSVAEQQWDKLPGGRVFFGGSEWSETGAGYMNGAIHNGRKHGSIVADLLRQ